MQRPKKTRNRLHAGGLKQKKGRSAKKRVTLNTRYFSRFVFNPPNIMQFFLTRLSFLFLALAAIFVRAGVVQNTDAQKKLDEAIARKDKDEIKRLEEELKRTTNVMIGGGNYGIQL